jgi:hypothetical protein
MLPYRYSLAPRAPVSALVGDGMAADYAAGVGHRGAAAVPVLCGPIFVSVFVWMGLVSASERYFCEGCRGGGGATGPPERVWGGAC